MALSASLIMGFVVAFTFAIVRQLADVNVDVNGWFETASRWCAEL
jgi:hypothetical protein